MIRGKRKKIISWHNRDFILLSAESSGRSDAAAETHQILIGFAQELGLLGLSLDNTVRTRLWARDAESRTQGARARVDILSGAARSASSSYVAPEYFASNSSIAIELLAMKPSKPGARKLLKEFDPPRIPLKYLVYDSFVFLSGMVVVLPTLSDQIEMVVQNITDTLREAGVAWDGVIRSTVYFHREESLETVREQFNQHIETKLPLTVLVPVDGFSRAGLLIEIEVTALQHSEQHIRNEENR